MKTLEELYAIIHLHTASGSIGDSILKIKDLVKKAKKLNIPAIAMTNHGSMADMYDFYFECVSNGIKPIIGCEVYTVEDRELKEKDNKATNHLILLAQNEIGLKNLLTICADAELVGKYYRPRTDLNFLESIDTTGIAATTACVGSEVNQLILDDKLEEAETLLLRLNNIFEDFYLEVQPGEFEDQITVNKQLVEFSNKLNIPLIASNDVHYLDAEDYLAHDGHVKVHRKAKLTDALAYPDKCYYVMSYSELFNSLAASIGKDNAKIAMDNTILLAEKCNVSIEIDGLNLPTFKCPEKFTPKTYLEYVCLKKLDKIKHKIKDVSEYMDRMYMELDVIEKLGFVSYFLIVRDFMEYAKENNILCGPGRGSVCGSLVAYLAGLTKVDAIKYNLLFDRFLSVHRVNSIPDVDMDIASAKRHMMFDYTVNKYGADYCAAVSTFQIRKAKSAIKDASRIMDIDDGDAIAKLIPMTHYDEEGDKMTDLSIKESLEVVPELREYHVIYPEMFAMAMKLEGLPRASSIHAAGTLIAKTPLHDLIPMIKKDGGELNATSFDLSQAERMMLVKYDFLGLSTLDVLADVQEQTGDIFDVEFDKYDDQRIWDLIGSRNTTGLFQIASKTYKDRMPRLSPKTIEELAACLALVRGPCISAGTDKLYMDIQEGKANVKHLHPVYDNATAETNGIMIYQEQLMECCKNFGLPLHEGYDLMKASAKKKMDKIESYKDELHALSQGIKVPENIFEEIFQMIVDSGLYSFNKSHAVAYAIMCYMTAYYKVNYPLEYMAAELSNIYINVAADKRKERVAETVKECRRLGIKFAEPQVGKSKWKFTVENDTIRIGLCAISSFGEKAYDSIEYCLAQECEPTLEDIYEEVNKTTCNKKAFNALIFAGAFGDRTEAYYKYCELREEEPQDVITFHKNLKINIYDDDREIEEGLLGFNYIHAITNQLPAIGYKQLKKRAKFECRALVTRVKKQRVKKTNEMMAFMTIETGDGALEVVVFSNVYEKYKKLLKKDALLFIKAEKDDDENCKLIGAA